MIRRVRLTLALFIASTALQAGTLFTDPGSHTSRYGDGFSLGSSFTVLTSGLEVTALGLYDTTGAGFLQSHDIGLWDVTTGNTEVASVTIPTGTVAGLLNGFRYVYLGSPVELTSGDHYILAAFYPVGENPAVNDHLFDCCGSGSNAATDPNFGGFTAAYTTSGFGSSAGHLTEPNGTVPLTTDYAGPNLLYSTVAPEPGTVTLFLLSGLVAAIVRKRVRV